MKSLLTLAIVFVFLRGEAQDTARHITFTKVEIEADYPGGQAAWIRFLNKNLHYTDDAGAFSGYIVAQFTVDTTGDISDIKVVKGASDAALTKEVIRVIGISGKWLPAIQNGHKVRSYKRVPISINLKEE